VMGILLCCSSYTESEMADVNEDHQEIAASILSKASWWAVSFAYTPATNRPRLADVVTHSVGGGVNLGARFKTEGAADKAVSFEEELELANSEDWTEGDDATPSSSAPFAPSISQWNFLVKADPTFLLVLLITISPISASEHFCPH
jgi:hypothetical protein